jgi:hypothetical protein
LEHQKLNLELESWNLYLDSGPGNWNPYFHQTHRTQAVPERMHQQLERELR